MATSTTGLGSGSGASSLGVGCIDIEAKNHEYIDN